MKTSLALAFCLLISGAHFAPAALTSPTLSRLFQEDTSYTVTNDFWASFQRSVVGWQNPNSNCLDNFGSWLASLSLIYLSLLSLGTNVLTESFSILMLEDMVNQFLQERCYFFTTLGDLSLTLGLLAQNQSAPPTYSSNILNYVAAIGTLVYLLFTVLSVLLNAFAFGIDLQNFLIGDMPKASLGFMAGDIFKGLAIVVQKNWIYE